ncbi:hypothetical protein CEXT_9991 [Caerostris extrusa]|uniref:Uncharacterized protein n=1 Tax=Caerostris extrusa TaxID=172846 RepID=A0AAV4TYS8_CAEEX|nr:hypothetical protein CEXT_9991 [Caerostris extrusa]
MPELMLTNRSFDSWTRVHQSILKKAHTRRESKCRKKRSPNLFLVCLFLFRPGSNGLYRTAVGVHQHAGSRFLIGLSPLFNTNNHSFPPGCVNTPSYIHNTLPVSALFKFLGPAISSRAYYTGPFSMAPVSMNKSCLLWCIRKISTDEY